MISRSEVDELAGRPKESPAALDAHLTDLRSRGAGILECIRYVRLNQECSLTQAADIVVNSPAWIEQKDAFLQHQQDMFEEFIADRRDRIEAIETTMTPDGTDVVVRMKPPIEPGAAPDGAT